MTALLGIDVGTTSLKVILYDLDGNVLGSALKEYSLITPGVDAAEVDAETYWSACCAAIRSALAANGLAPAEVAALSISSQGETIIPLDEHGKPLRRAIVWLDNRPAAEAAQIEKAFGAGKVFEVTGQPEVVPTWPACKILWIRNHEPEVFRATAKFVLVEEYLLYKFSGRFVAEKSVQTSSILLDIRNKCWWEDMLGFVGISPQQLGDLLEPGEVAGYVCEQAAAETGLTCRTAVVTGSMDQMAGAVGAGNIRPGLVSVTTGAALAVCATLPGLVLDPQRRVPTHYHAIKDRYCLLPFGQVGGMALRWWRDAFCQPEMQTAAQSGLDAYDLLTHQAAQTPPGCEGLVFLPHLMGAASPEFDPAVRGVFYGIALKHQKAHFIRAIMESVVYMLKKNLDMVENISGVVGEIRPMGGGARSPLWLSMMADTLGKNVRRVANEEAASLGVALMAGVATGVFKDIDEAQSRMVRMGQVIEPNPARQEAYARGYLEYLDLYETLAPLFKRSLERNDPLTHKG